MVLCGLVLGFRASFDGFWAGRRGTTGVVYWGTTGVLAPQHRLLGRGWEGKSKLSFGQAG